MLFEKKKGSVSSNDCFLFLLHQPRRKRLPKRGFGSSQKKKKSKHCHLSQPPRPPNGPPPNGRSHRISLFLKKDHKAEGLEICIGRKVGKHKQARGWFCNALRGLNVHVRSTWEGREAEQSGNVRDFPDTEKRGAFASGIFMSTFYSWNNVKLEWVAWQKKQGELFSSPHCDEINPFLRCLHHIAVFFS